MLAVLRGPDCAARRALLATGTTAEDFEARVADTHPRSDGPRGSGVASTPSFLAVRAAAQVFAAMAGRVEPDAADAVLGVLYADAWAHGEGGEHAPTQIVAALAEHGVTVPPTPPPERRPWRSPCSTPLPTQLVDAALRLLLERHPPGDGPQWGFDTLADHRQVIIHEAERDLSPILAEASRAPARTEHRRTTERADEAVTKRS